MSGPWSLWQLSALVLNMTPAINPSQASISRKKKKPYIKLIPGSSDVTIKRKTLYPFIMMISQTLWFLRLHFPTTRNFHWTSTWSILKLTLLLTLSLLSCSLLQLKLIPRQNWCVSMIKKQGTLATHDLSSLFQFLGNLSTLFPNQKCHQVLKWQTLNLVNILFYI